MAHVASARAKIPTENPQLPRPGATRPAARTRPARHVTPPRRAERNRTRGYTQ